MRCVAQVREHGRNEMCGSTVKRGVTEVMKAGRRAVHVTRRSLSSFSLSLRPGAQAFPPRSFASKLNRTVS